MSRVRVPSSPSKGEIDNESTRRSVVFWLAILPDRRKSVHPDRGEHLNKRIIVLNLQISELYRMTLELHNRYTGWGAAPVQMLR